VDQTNPTATAAASLVDEYIVTNEEYAGLGSGSFGYLRGSTYANTFSIPRYIESLKQGNLPVLARRRFSRKEQIRYDFLMKMFAGSLDLSQLAEKHGGNPGRELWRELMFFRLTGALQSGAGKALALNRKGYYFLVILMREFFTGVNNFREACMSAIDADSGRGEKRLASSL
jgi:coproporphyrinogen III oxidase-like Fe-S oxidoreductase